MVEDGDDGLVVVTVAMAFMVVAGRCGFDADDLTNLCPDGFKLGSMDLHISTRRQ